MRTTLDLNAKLVDELLRVTGVETKTEAIHLAMSELIRRKKMERLKSLSGKIRIDLNWRKMEQAELVHQKRRRGRRDHR